MTAVKAALNVKFTVLALGSSVYPDFCRAGVQLDSKLASAGLDRFVTLTKADNAAGAGGMISKWINLMKNIILALSLKTELAVMGALHFDSDAILVHSLQFLSSCGQNMSGSPDLEGASLCLSNDELLEEPNEMNSI